MPIPIELEGDRPRTLKFTLGTIRDLETLMDGKTVAEIVVIIARLGMNAMVATLYAGLKHEDASLNMKLVTKMLERHIHGKKDGRERLRKLAEAFDQAFEETGIFASEDDEGNVQPEPVASS